MTVNKFLIVLAHDGKLDFADIAERSWTEYAMRHGYSYNCQKFVPQERGLGHPSWQKLGLLQHLVGEQAWDWILWADTDTVVTNYARIDFDFYDTDSGDWMFVSKDWNDYSPWSAGVMLIRSCPEALAFLREAETHTEYRDAGTWDQNAMHDVWRAKPDGVKILPRRILQSVPRDVVGSDEPWEPGDFCAHITGVPNQQKRRHMEAYNERAIR